MTAADFADWRLASGAEESSHSGVADFRVGGHIFATLAHVQQGYGNLMLTPELQAQFVGDAPKLFLPVQGGWGRMGATHVRLAEASHDVLAGALRAAWTLRVEKNGAGKRKRAGAARRTKASTKKTPA